MMTLTYCIEQATTEGVVNTEVLRALLTAREDNVKDHLRLAASQFGMFPEIVAEIIAQIGIGTLPSAEERALIQSNFIAKMQELTERQGE